MRLTEGEHDKWLEATATANLMQGMVKVVIGVREINHPHILLSIRKTKTKQEGDTMDTCDYCDGAKPLVIGDTNDKGIAVHNTGKLVAYGYDVHGGGSNGLAVRICFCPMCGKRFVR